MIYILLPIHNRRIITLNFVNCLLNQTYKDYKLILIDDGSTDNTSTEVLLKIPETIVIKGNGNWWWAGALQKGYEYLQQIKVKDEDIALLINDDTTFDEDFLKNGVNLMNGKIKTLVKSLSIDIETNQFCDGYIFADLNHLKFHEITNVNKANCASTRGLFLNINEFFEIGGFYPKKLPHYLSDYEFTIRAFKKGFKIITDNRLFLYADFKTTGIQNIQSFTSRNYLKNLFTNSNAGNPIHWINFILLASDNKFQKVKNIIRVILWTFKNFFVSIKTSIISRVFKENNS